MSDITLSVPLADIPCGTDSKYCRTKLTVCRTDPSRSRNRGGTNTYIRVLDSGEVDEKVFKRQAHETHKYLVASLDTQEMTAVKLITCVRVV